MRAFHNLLNLFMSAILIGYYIIIIISTISILEVCIGNMYTITDPPVYSCQYNYINNLKLIIYLLPYYYPNYNISNKYIEY